MCWRRNLGQRDVRRQMKGKDNDPKDTVCGEHAGPYTACWWENVSQERTPASFLGSPPHHSKPVTDPKCYSEFKFVSLLKMIQNCFYFDLFIEGIDKYLYVYVWLPIFMKCRRRKNEINAVSCFLTKKLFCAVCWVR